MRATAIAAGVAAAGFVAATLLLGGWLIMAAGGGQTSEVCGAPRVPAPLAPLFVHAATQYELGPSGPTVLAGLTKVESDFGRNLGPSSAGAVGWTQFLPETWRRFGVDADGDGRRDPMDAADAIHGAARYLRHLGAPADWHRALLGYNHAESYVHDVLEQARRLRQASSDVVTCESAAVDPRGGRLLGGGRIVAIPGQPGQLIDERLVQDLGFLERRFHIQVTAGYAPTGHAPHGEHPLGLAVDVVPGPEGTWDDVDSLARWAEPSQDHPRPPWRWVGYDGDPGHGRGNHLHLSWRHGPGRPAAWVDVLLGA